MGGIEPDAAAGAVDRRAGAGEGVERPVAEHLDPDLGQDPQRRRVDRLDLVGRQDLDRAERVDQPPPRELWQTRRGAARAAAAGRRAARPRASGGRRDSSTTGCYGASVRRTSTSCVAPWVTDLPPMALRVAPPEAGGRLSRRDPADGPPLTTSRGLRESTTGGRRPRRPRNHRLRRRSRRHLASDRRRATRPAHSRGHRTGSERPASPARPDRSPRSRCRSPRTALVARPAQETRPGSMPPPGRYHHGSPVGSAGSRTWNSSRRSWSSNRSTRATRRRMTVEGPCPDLRPTPATLSILTSVSDARR